MAVFKKNYLALLFLLVLLFVIRVGGISIPYHQDEYKTALAVSSNSEALGSYMFHPPLSELLLTAAAQIFADDQLRWWPLVLSMVNLVLLFFIVRQRYGFSAAVVAGLLYGILFYSVLASLMLDIDGQMLPFALLLFIAAYDYYRSQDSTIGRTRGAALLVTAALIGFMIKLSFIIPVIAVLFDYVLAQKILFSRSKMVQFSIILGVFGCATVVVFLTLPLIFPWFQLGSMWGHAMSFINFADRNYLQISIQVVKVMIYLSPLPFALLMLGGRSLWESVRLWWLLILSSLGFYLVAFDFAQGALDKYLMVLIVPLCVLGGLAFNHLNIASYSRRILGIGMLVGVSISVLIIAASFLPHTVPPLYPKSAWLSLVLHGHWNFLMPFTGGSGPVGFYMSWLTIMLSFIFSFILVIIGLWRRRWQSMCMVAIIVIGVVYNGLMISEYMYGWHYGSSTTLVEKTLLYIDQQHIPSVITYNDTGAYQLRRDGRYANRFYVMGELSDVHRQRFNEHRGYYMVIEIPRLNAQGGYVGYFNQCLIEYETMSGMITSRIYDCRQAESL